LRESGSIEQDSDNVLLLHRPELFGQATLSDGTLSKNILEVRVAKNRNGPQGNIRLYFDGSRMLISNLQEAEKEELGELPF
jgi:replicative DNA helicase